MKLFRRLIPWCIVAIFLPAGVQADTITSVHTTWLWHLHQLVCGPDCRNHGADHYENAPEYDSTAGRRTAALSH